MPILRRLRTHVRHLLSLCCVIQKQVGGAYQRYLNLQSVARCHASGVDHLLDFPYIIKQSNLLRLERLLERDRRVALDIHGLIAALLRVSSTSIFANHLALLC